MMFTWQNRSSPGISQSYRGTCRWKYQYVGIYCPCLNPTARSSAHYGRVTPGKPTNRNDGRLKEPFREIYITWRARRSFNIRPATRTFESFEQQLKRINKSRYNPACTRVHPLFCIIGRFVRWKQVCGTSTRSCTHSFQSVGDKWSHTRHGLLCISFSC